MKKLLFVLLVFLIGAVSVVLAQNLFSAKSDTDFAPIEWVGSDFGKKPDLSVGQIRMSDGTTCYFLTPAQFALELDNLGDIASLGCVN
jgi:hypothetical protein